MKLFFTVPFLAVMFSGTQLSAGTNGQSLEKLQNASCSLFQIYRSNRDVLRPDVAIYFDGLLNGATAGHVPTAFFLEEFEALCDADPSAELENTLNGAREAVLKRMQ